MNKLRRAAALAALSLAAVTTRVHAQPAGTTAAGVIDLLPGQDAYGGPLLAINPVTDRLYAMGSSLPEGNPVIKVIDTGTKQIIAGVDLGRYAHDAFIPAAMAVDSSAAPAGNKIYVLGRADYPNFVLRVIDGETNENATGEGTDIVLPPFNLGAQVNMAARMVVNPNNHKVYISDGSGKIIVVDGEKRSVLTTLNPNAGDFLVLSPQANKVFVLAHQDSGAIEHGAIIDSATDTFTSLALSTPYATAATFNPANNRVYFGGRVDTRWGMFVLDGTTGELVMEKTGDEFPVPYWLAISPSRNALFTNPYEASDDYYHEVGYEYAADTLTFRRKIADQIFGFVTDVEGGDDLFFRAPEAVNAVGMIDLATMKAGRIPLGYRPLGLAANSRTDRLYVSDVEAPELLVLKPSSGAVVARVPLDVRPGATEFYQRSIAVSERLNRVYVSRRGVIDVVDGTTHQVRRPFTVGGGGAIAVDDTRRRIYVGFAVPGRTSFPTAGVSVAVYDADSEALLQTLEISEPYFGGAFQNIAVNPVLGRLYVLDGRSITTIDTTTNLVIATETVPPHRGIAVNKRTGKVFVGINRSAPNSSPQVSDIRIAVLNGLSGTIEAEFAPPAGDYFGIHTVVVDEVSNRFYVAQAPLPGGQSRLHRIIAYDSNTYELLNEHTSADATHMLFEPASRKLFVVNEQNGSIDMFQSTTAAEPDLLGNISTRGSVSAGDGALIGGFIITGAPGTTKKVAVRAIGPSLGAAGVAGAISDTTLELHDSAGNVIANDDWKLDAQTNSSQEEAIAATGLAPASALESVVVATLPAGPSTAVVRGKNGASGVALVEVYDLEQSATAGMANIATRGAVGTGENVMIGGFIVLGSNSSRLLVRAIGPSLTAAVPSALQDPVLELRDPNGALIASNDDWASERGAESTETTIQPLDARESAVLAMLHPGNYTAIVRGKGDTTGIALVEAYKLK